MSLVFYDTETTGTKTFYDQILQFAAIRTDADLNVIDRFEIRCRLLPHVVPAPGAMRVTGIHAAQLTDPKLPSHYEMICQIRERLLGWSPCLYIGYNSVEFDEDLLRQAFYKTLHPPYLTNTNGNTRSDVIRMVQACSLFYPDVLEVPMTGNGKPTFRLDRLGPANGFAHEHAHDAMADVEATIFLSRLLKERAPEVWSSFMRFSKKPSVVDYITAEPVFCLGEFFFSKPFSFLVTALAANAENSSEWYVYDLSVHPESLQSLNDAQLASRLKKSPKPLRRMRVNAAPMVFPADQAPYGCSARSLSQEELAARVGILADEEFRLRLINAFEALKEPYPPSPHVERQIYDGFFGNQDQNLMEQFHKLNWSERPALVDKFVDPRLRTIGLMLIHLERPNLLNKSLRDDHALQMARRMAGVSGDEEWLTLPQALGELGPQLAAAASPEKDLLQGHYDYLASKLEEAMRLLG